MNTQQAIKKAHLLLDEIKGLLDSQTKPADAPTWELPPLPAGMEYHRTDWTQDMLPDGYRPLLLGEVNVPGVDERECGGMRSGEWLPLSSVEASASHHPHLRTARPLPVKPDPFAAEKAAFAAGKTIQYYSKSILEWLDCYPCPPSWAPDYAYRVKPEPALVPLGPDDVPPFSAIRWSGWETTEWALVLRVTNETVYFSDRRAGSATLNDLRAGNVKINRSIPLTGKWDADAWTACFKEVQP